MLSRHLQLALLDPTSSSVVAVPTPDGPRLPRHPERWPDHRDLLSELRAPDAVLVAPPWREDDGTVTYVLVGSASGLEGAAWHPLDDLDPLALSPAAAAGIRRAATEQVQGAPDDGRAAWFRPGWRDRVDAWVDEVLPLHGCARTGPAEAIKIWSLSAVLRYPVLREGEEGELWFKATCEGFRTEPALTQAVCRLVPSVMPQVLAVEPDEAWMLMERIDEPEEGVGAAHAPDIARALARLQLDTLAERELLRRAGLPDRGLESTLASMRVVLHDSVEQHLMPEGLREAAAALEPWLEERLRSFWSHGLPDTLSHGDLHLGNVAWVRDHPVFFDWTDACLTHPFLDARHLADDAFGSGGEEARTAVWEAYAEAWRAACPGLDLDAAWAQVREAEAVFQMISYEQIYRAQPEVSRWELATVVVEILQKLVEVRDAQD